MKILIIGLNYAPELVGIGPYTAGLAESLASTGHRVEAIVGEPYYPRWKRFATPPPVGKRQLERGVGVTRCRHYIPREPTGSQRVLHHLSFGLSATLPALMMALRLRPDVVFTVTPSLATVPLAWLVARLTGARLWTHVQDFEVEAAFATGLLDRQALSGRLARWVEHRCLRLAERVSTISPQMIDRLVANGIAATATYQLRNCANAGFAPDPLQAARYRREWNIGERKVALYSGSIANKQGIGIMVEAARKLCDRKDLVFVICGQGPTRQRLRALSAGLPNFQLHDLQPHDRMGGLLALAHIHVLTQIREAADLVLPSKLSNMLASRRPIVATADPGTGIAAEVEGCGLVIPPGDADALAAAIARLADDQPLADAFGRAAGERARERWGQAEILERFETELVKLIRSPRPAAKPARGPEPPS